MKWIAVEASDNNDGYELWDDQQKILTLHTNPRLGTTRIDCSLFKRMFMIDRKGLLRARSVIRNEYGVRIGELVTEKKLSHEGEIELNDRRLFYQLRYSPDAELIIYETSIQKPLLKCELNAADAEKMIQLGNGHVRNATCATSLLTALCWYLFQPQVKPALAIG